MNTETKEQISAITMQKEDIAEQTEEAIVAEEVAEPPVPERTDVTCRLAEEFLLLAEEFPKIQSPDQLPDAVLDTATEQGISLLDAYLRHRWQEEKRVLAATEQQQQAARRSAGSLSAGSEPVPPEQNAFLRAFRRAL